MISFVWTKMGTESGDTIERIILRKEVERQNGNGIFWWGIGNSLGTAVRLAARSQGGTLPVLFSPMLAPAKEIDTTPESVLRRTAWEDENGDVHDIPPFANVVSRGFTGKSKHYALVCRSTSALKASLNGERFDPTTCLTTTGKRPGPSAVTALLKGAVNHDSGPYGICFRAELIEPWAVKVVRPVIVTSN